jgi:quercetin dioxygenase-like cupin family protein
MVDFSKIDNSLVYSSDIIGYQENSVVSRTIIDKTAGSITFFAFAEDQGLSEHSAPFDALVYIIDGKAEVVISGKPYRLKKDEIIIMPANEPHSLSAITKFKMMLVMIKSS